MNGRFLLLGMFLLVLSAPVFAADVAGDWRVTISTSEGTVSGLASFKTTGNVVKGWVGPSESDPISVDGILEGNKLTIRTHPRPGRTVAFIKCEVTVNGDRMVGTIDTNKGTIEFVKATALQRPK